jgi:hypothetical protein
MTSGRRNTRMTADEHRDEAGAAFLAKFWRMLVSGACRLSEATETIIPLTAAKSYNLGLP